MRMASRDASMSVTTTSEPSEGEAGGDGASDAVASAGAGNEGYFAVKVVHFKLLSCEGEPDGSGFLPRLAVQNPIDPKQFTPPESGFVRRCACG